MLPETKAYKKFIKLFHSNDLVIKLHGNLYQKGLPDLMIIGNNGKIEFVEMKVLKTETIPKIMLRKYQFYLARQIAQRKIPTYYVFYYKDEFYKVNVLDLNWDENQKLKPEWKLNAQKEQERRESKHT